ncbi:MAG: hypothetical protein GY953_00420, partial [bacterium]|nr:hypothetical protein [bacterium]
MRFRGCVIAGVGIVLLLSACGAGGDGQGSRVEIAARENGFQLLFNGSPYFVKGAGGNQYLDKLIESGGNSIRRWETTAEDLREASRRGLTVLAGIPLGKPRKGFDYADTLAMAGQMELVRQTVRSYRDHPALLMWALGNETELDASAEDRLLVWNAIEQLAAVVKQEDPNHPVITVIAGAGGGKVAELAEHCPTLDAIGVNAYGEASRIADALARQGWNKPYLVTEFGPRGHWEVEKTPWDLPIEDDSTTKAAHYLESYEKAVLDQTKGIGSYVFLWGEEQEKTHTWYGMFLPDGSPTAAMDVMTYV